MMRRHSSISLILCATILAIMPAPADAQCPASGPVLTNPGNGTIFETAQSVTFQWNSVANAEDYRIVVTDSVFEATLVDEIVTGTSFEPAFGFGDGSYEWFVEAQNATNTCDPMSSPLFTFTVEDVCLNPLTPEPDSPADGATVSSPVSFSWLPSQPQADDYWLHFYDYQLNTDLLYGPYGSTSAGNVNLSPGNYDWWVEAATAACGSIFSAFPRSITVAGASCPSGPNLSSPSNNATVTSPVTFSWSSVASAEDYLLHIENPLGPITLEIGTFGATSKSEELTPGAWTWWVEALVPGCDPSPVSAIRNVNVQGGGNCPAGPSLSTPSNNATVSSPVTFSWISVTGAEDYVLHLESVDDPGAFFDINTFGATSKTEPLDPGNWDWWVEAILPDCDPFPSSNVRTITVEGSGGGDCPALVTLYSPEFGEFVTSPVYFEWEGVDGADTYKLQIQQNGVDVISPFVTPDVFAVFDLDPGDYEWWVSADVPGCNPLPVSDSFPFSVESSGGGICPEIGPYLESPEPGEEVSSPVLLQWEALDGVSSYHLVVISYPDAGLVIDETVLANTYSAVLPPGEYDWYVEADITGCPVPESDYSYFTVPCDKGAPDLLAPDNESEQSGSVTFSWTAVPEAIAYNLNLFLWGDYFIFETFPGTTATYDLPPGEYDWYVEAVFSDCPPEESEWWYFEIGGSGDCDVDEPMLIQPLDDAEVGGSPVTFEWTSVSSANAYWLVISSDFEEFFIAAETTGTTVDIALGPGEYLWYVVALSDECDWLESDLFYFELEEGTNCPDDEVDLISPDDDEIVQGPITFEWNAVPNAIEYDLYIEPLDGALTYIGTTSGTSFTLDRIEPGEYYWVIDAFFPDCFPIESDFRYFEVPFDEDCDNDFPFPFLPQEGARNVPNPTRFEWIPVDGADGYQVWASLNNGVFLPVGSEVATAMATIDVGVGQVEWFVEARFDGCPSEFSESSHYLSVAASTECGISNRTTISGPGIVASGESFTVFWAGLAKAASWEVQEAPTDAFRSITSKTTTDFSSEFSHDVTQRTTKYYRVRAIDSCSNNGPFSSATSVTIVPTEAPTDGEFDLFSMLGDADPINQNIFIPGSSGKRADVNTAARGNRQRGAKRPPGDRFSVQTNATWLTITPSSGVLPSSGTTVTATVNPTQLPPGTSSATVSVTTSSTTGSTTVPVTVSLVTPTTPAPGSTPPPKSQFFPVLAHTAARTSNISFVNLTTETLKYQLTFVPTGANGTQTGQQTYFQIEPGQTASLDDTLGTWFGSASSTLTGTLEVRPLEEDATNNTRSTVTSGVTYGTSVSGSLGTFVNPISFSRFVGKSTATNDTTLTIPNIFESGSKTTSIGLLEGNGEMAQVQIAVYNENNVKVVDQTETIQPRQQRELSTILQSLSLNGGRAEIKVLSTTGKVAAYARVTDKQSGDAAIINARRVTTMPGGKYIVPGATSATGRKTDLLLFNPTASPVQATLTFYPDGNPSGATTKQATIQPGQSTLLTDVVGSTFGLTSTTGAVHVTTPAAEKLLTTATTYRTTANGNIGSTTQAVTPDKAINASNPALQMLQLEASGGRTTNLALAEVGGNPAKVRITAIAPGALSAPTTTLQLQANEYRSVASILESMGLRNTKNVRLSVKVTEGTGSVAAFACLVDKTSGDEIVIPGQ